jgi:peroxiredoxin Q/BCP
MLGLLKYVAKQALGITGEKHMLVTGDQAPDFRVDDHTGTPRTLGDYAGRHLVLWFYPKADTPG